MGYMLDKYKYGDKSSYKKSNSDNSEGQAEKDEAKRQKGIRAERLVKSELRKLGDGVKILNNIDITDTIENSQIDHLIICSKGIVHVETKAWSGKYTRIYSNKWMLNDRSYKIDNDPITQMAGHEKMLNRYLGTLKGYKNIPYKGILVQVDIFGELEILDSSTLESLNFEVLDLNNLLGYLKYYISDKSIPDSLSSEEIEKLYNLILFHSVRNNIITFFKIIFSPINKFVKNLTFKHYALFAVIIFLAFKVYCGAILPSVSNNIKLYKKSATGKFFINQAMDYKSEIAFGNDLYKNGISTVVENNSTTAITLRLKYLGISLNRKVFKGIASVDNNNVWDENSQASVKIFHGDTLIYDSGLIVPWGDPAEIKADVDGLDEITLVFTYENPTPSKLCIAIAEPELY